MNQLLFANAKESLRKLSSLLSGESFKNALDLIDLILSQNKRLVLYLGAGCSKTVKVDAAGGYPQYQGKNWDELLEALVNDFQLDYRTKFINEFFNRAESRESNDFPSLKDLYKYYDKLQLAWFITTMFANRLERAKAIKRIVDPSSPEKRRSKLYEELMQLPFNDVVTTNYDSNTKWFIDNSHSTRHLPENYKENFDASQSKSTEICEIYDRHTLTSSFNRTVARRLFYLHGKAGETDKLILDRFDYAELLAERDGVFDFVTYLLRDSHVLYVGFGLDDPSFNIMETRLFSLDRQARPPSFAFVLKAIKKEHENWANRNLYLIEFKEYDNLPIIFECMNTIIKYIRWAEPDRPSGVNRNIDRTWKYMEIALDSYVSGDFEKSLQNCRAALATTLFWQDEISENEEQTQRASKLCDIRIRMALNHYKLRFAPPFDKDDDHEKLREVNVKVARDIINVYIAINDKDWIPYENSINIIEARTLYHQGQYLQARDIYKKIIEKSKPFVEELNFNLAIPVKIDTFEKRRVLNKLKAFEANFYAICQNSRIEYQLLENINEDIQNHRCKERNHLIKLAESINEIIIQLKDFEPQYKICPEWRYYYKSLNIIFHIAKWTAGRHGVGIFSGIIPLKEERNESNLNELNKGLELLAFEQFGLEDSECKPSSRWLALRNRYLARAYALRWLINLELVGHNEQNNFHSDLNKAYEWLQEAFQITNSPGMERQKHLNNLEATRINILALYGEKIIYKNQRQHTLSPLTIAAALYYLNCAFIEIEKKINTLGAYSDWLKALGYLLASFIGLITKYDRRAPNTKSQLLLDFFARDLRDQKKMVIETYRNCSRLMDGSLDHFKTRIFLFEKTYDAIKKEFF